MYIEEIKPALAIAAGETLPILAEETGKAEQDLLISTGKSSLSGREAGTNSLIWAISDSKGCNCYLQSRDGGGQSIYYANHLKAVKMGHKHPFQKQKLQYIFTLHDTILSAQ